MKITGIRTVPYAFEMARPLGDANNPYGNAKSGGLAMFLETDSGVTGTFSGDASVRQIVHALVDELLVGQDPRGVVGLTKKMVDRAFKGGNRGAITRAISALDIVMWDAKAKANNEPVWRTLGASEPRVKAYASGIDLNLSDDEIYRFYAGMADLGVDGGKLKVGLDMESDLRRLHLMHDALKRSGKTPRMLIDSNEYWSPKQAIRHIRRIEREFDLTWVEEPARRWDYRGLRQVSEAVNAAVATGENLDAIEDFMPLIANQAVDVVEIGQRTTGITGAMQVAHMAHGFEIPVAMMNCAGHFMAHLAAALPNHMMMEAVQAGRSACFTVDTRIEDGYIVIGETPGLGMVFDEQKLARLAVSDESRVVPSAGWGRRKGAALYEIPPGASDEA
jgi:L-alanine-DL-glutamate epimerase-like enolase superfamily enzyme